MRFKSKISAIKALFKAEDKTIRCHAIAFILDLEPAKYSDDGSPLFQLNHVCKALGIRKNQVCNKKLTRKRIIRRIRVIVKTTNDK